MKTKIMALSVLAVTAGVFAYIRPHNAIPSDLKDAVADNTVFDTTIPAFETDNANFLVPTVVTTDIKTNATVGKIPKKDKGVVTKELTVMVYIMGSQKSRELTWWRDTIIRELAKGNTSDNINLVIETSKMSDTEPQGRYLHTPNSSYLSKISELNGAITDYRELIDFGVWAKKMFPAKRYILLILGHGSTWWNDTRKPMVPDTGNKGIGYYSDDTGNYISTVELGMALRKMGGVDVLGIPSCGEQTIEVVYEVSDSVKVVAGSEEVMNLNDMRSRWFMEHISSNPSMPNEEIGKLFVLQYAHEGLPACFSALRTKNLPTLVEHIRLFAELAMTEDPQLLIKAVKGSYGINPESNFSAQSDLVDAIKSVIKQTTNEQIKVAGETVINYYLNEVLIYAANSHNRRLHGSSVYFPVRGYNRDYNTLRFAKDSGWAQIINAY